jgi:hypothetical protein
MRKIELIDLVISNLSGGEKTTDQSGKFHRRTVERYIEQALNNLLGDLCLVAKKTGDYSFLEPHVRPFNNVKVEHDENRDEYYCFIPSPYVSLPGQLGIFEVRPMKDRGKVFHYQQNGSNSVFDELEVNTQGFVDGFYIENNRLFFDSVNEPCKVLVKIIVPFSRLNDEDQVPGPYAKEYNLFDAVRQQMGLPAQTKEDLNTNNTAE